MSLLHVSESSCENFPLVSILWVTNVWFLARRGNLVHGLTLNFPHFFAYLLKVCNYEHGYDEKFDATTDTLNANGVLIDKYLNFAELNNKNKIIIIIIIRLTYKQNYNSIV